MKEDAITLETLAKRLGHILYLDDEKAKHGLIILLYGWRMKYQMIDVSTISQRRIRDGEPWLSYGEACSFSRYCGYDLTHD